MSLLNTYQNCKTSFANKLQNLGINAKSSDGLTTLINYLDNIQHFTDGIMLYSDKSAIQSSNTVTLSTLIMKDGKPAIGKTVNFYEQYTPTLIVSLSSNIVNKNEAVEIIVAVTDNHNEGVPNQEIRIIGEEPHGASVFDVSQTTNNNGIATHTYIGQGVGNIEIWADWSDENTSNSVFLYDN